MQIERERWLRSWPEDAGAWTNFLLILLASSVYAPGQRAPWGLLGLGMHLCFFMGSAWALRYCRFRFFRHARPTGQGLLSSGAALLALGLTFFAIRLSFFPPALAVKNGDDDPGHKRNSGPALSWNCARACKARLTKRRKS